MKIEMEMGNGVRILSVIALGAILSVGTWKVHADPYVIYGKRPVTCTISAPRPLPQLLENYCEDEIPGGLNPEDVRAALVFGLAPRGALTPADRQELQQDLASLFATAIPDYSATVSANPALGYYGNRIAGISSPQHGPQLLADFSQQPPMVQSVLSNDSVGKRVCKKAGKLLLGFTGIFDIVTYVGNAKVCDNMFDQCLIEATEDPFWTVDSELQKFRVNYCLENHKHCLITAGFQVGLDLFDPGFGIVFDTQVVFDRKGWELEYYRHLPPCEDSVVAAH